MSTELMPTSFDVDDRKMLDTLKNTIAKDLSDEEFKILCMFCKQTGLNPFMKEVWALKWVSKKTGKTNFHIMVGINGYHKIANSHPAFDNLESEWTEDSKGNVTGAWCKVYRKDRTRPTSVRVKFSEYTNNQDLWLSKPAVMCTKVAEAVAIRKAFILQLGGSYIPEEMGNGALHPIENNGESSNGEPVIRASAEPPVIYLYKFDELTPDQEQFLNDAKCTRDPESNIWQSRISLGRKLEKYLVKESEEKKEIAIA